jgi:uncharacterized protein
MAVMTPRIRRAVLLFVALFVASPLHAQTTTSSGRNVLWKATRGQGVVYLVGSVHLLTKDYYPLSPALDAAFKESDHLVEELDMGEMEGTDAQMQLLIRSQLPSGQSLDKVLTPTTYALVHTKFASLGLPVEIIRQFKPWSLSLMLLQLEWAKAGFDPALGLDKHFYDRAKKDGKSVQALETIEYQLSRFDGLSMEQQERLLAETIKDLEKEVANVTRLVNAWKAGDVATLEKLSLEDAQQDPMIYQRFLVERNRNWMPAVEALFARATPAFVVVGAAHLIGPDGLVQMLKAKGYSVEQL